jgi:Uma2 family endonuclease
MIRRREALGLDTFDEVWEGVYHVAPAAQRARGYVDHALAVALDPYAKAAGLVPTGPFNLGTADDYRVPDHGYHRGFRDDAWVPSAAIVVEVVSPDDETYAKFGFYAAHGVEELIVADPHEQTVRCFQRQVDGFVETAGSDLLAISAAEITGAIEWPPRG